MILAFFLGGYARKLFLDVGISGISWFFNWSFIASIDSNFRTFLIHVTITWFLSITGDILGGFFVDLFILIFSFIRFWIVSNARFSRNHLLQFAYTLSVQWSPLIAKFTNDALRNNRNTVAGFFFFISNARRSAAQFKHKSWLQANIKMSSGRELHLVHVCGSILFEVIINLNYQYLTTFTFR